MGHIDVMSVPDPMVKPTLTVVEAGALLGLSRAAAYHAAKTGAIPTLRIGRRLLVPTHQLREMLGFHNTHASEREARVDIHSSLDRTLRDAMIAAAEAFLHVMKHGNDA